VLHDTQTHVENHLSVCTPAADSAETHGSQRACAVGAARIASHHHGKVKSQVLARSHGVQSATGRFSLAM